MKKYSQTIIPAIAASIGVYEVFNIGKDIDYTRYIIVVFSVIMVLGELSRRIKIFAKNFSDTIPTYVSFIVDLIEFIQLIFINILTVIALQLVSNKDSENYAQGNIQKLLFFFFVFIIFKSHVSSL